MSSGVATPPMWHITFAPPPAISQPRIARLSGSVPALATTFSEVRTFTPSAMSAFSRHRAARGVGVREAEVVELGLGEAGQADVGDVDEGVQAAARRGHHVAAEGGEVVRARVARRHQRGGALERNQLVGRDADRRAVRIDVGVQIDEPRQHQLAGGVEHAVGARRRNVGLDRRDLAEAEADVALAAQLLRRVEQLAALDHQVELVVRLHLRAQRAADRAQRECRTHSGDEAPAIVRSS